MTTLVLLSFVAFVVPYQFAYLVACIVQLATTVRALKCAHDNVCGRGPWPREVLNTNLPLTECWRSSQCAVELLSLYPLDNDPHVVDSTNQLTSLGCLDT